MENETASNGGRFNAVVIVLLAVLLIVVAAQSAFLLKLNNTVADTPSAASAERNDTSTAEKVETTEDDTIALLPSPDLRPFDDDFFKGFDQDWNPFKEMERMREQIDSVFNDGFGKFRSVPGFDSDWLSGDFMPDTDFEETDEAYILTLDVPGTSESKVEVSVVDDVVSIKGTREETDEEEIDKGKVVRSERRLGSFQRSFTLPGPADETAMTTDYKDGVLTVTIPKAINEPSETT